MREILRGIDEIEDVAEMDVNKGMLDQLQKLKTQTVKDCIKLEPGDDLAFRVSREAHRGNPVARLLMGIFFYWYGKAIADQIVTFCPKDMYLTGGIILKNIELVTNDSFVKNCLHRAIERKGRMGVITKSVSIKIILEQDVGLLGASRALE